MCIYLRMKSLFKLFWILQQIKCALWEYGTMVLSLIAAEVDNNDKFLNDCLQYAEDTEVQR